MQLPIPSPLKCHTGLVASQYNFYYVYGDYSIKSCLLAGVELHVLLCCRVFKRYYDSLLRPITNESAWEELQRKHKVMAIADVCNGYKYPRTKFLTAMVVLTQFVGEMAPELEPLGVRCRKCMQPLNMI